jgi:thymidylate synthase
MISRAISAPDANSALIETAYEILRNGRAVSPRGILTYEIPVPTIEITDPTKCVVTLTERKMPYNFMSMELVWLLNGTFEPWISQYLKKWEEYVDDLHGMPGLAGSYGYRLINAFEKDQIRWVINELKTDPDSRRAILTISYPDMDLMGYKDFPCTRGLQFALRGGKLECYVSMRSNDLLKGWCSDIFSFCSLQCILASILEVELGSYYHTAVSMHIYDSDIPQFQHILDYPHAVVNPGIPSLKTISYDKLDEVYEDASYGEKLKSTRELPKNKRWLTRLMQAVINRIDQKEVMKEKENSVVHPHDNLV